jgi:hypothetical protein
MSGEKLPARAASVAVVRPRTDFVHCTPSWCITALESGNQTTDLERF